MPHRERKPAAIGKEDPALVDMNEEMSRFSDFTALREVTEKLQCAAKSLATLRKRAHPREVGVFVASDTAGGLAAARQSFPDAVTIEGITSTHTSQSKSADTQAKIVADFYGLSLGDARRDSAEDFSRLNALLYTAMDRILIPAYCFANS